MAKKLKQKTDKQKVAGRKASKARRLRTKQLVADSTGIVGVFGDKFVPRAGLSTRAPFFASQLKNVCRTTQVGAKCKGPRNSKVTRGDLGLDRSGSAEELRDACLAAGYKFEKGRTKPIRAGKMEIDFLSPAQATALNTLPGPNLRLCVRDDKRGFLVPVTSPAEAAALGHEFSKKVNNKKADMPRFAAELAARRWSGRAPPLGALVAGGRLTSSLFGGR